MNSLKHAASDQCTDYTLSTSTIVVNTQKTQAYARNADNQN